MTFDQEFQAAIIQLPAERFEKKFEAFRKDVIRSAAAKKAKARKKVAVRCKEQTLSEIETLEWSTWCKSLDRPPEEAERLLNELSKFCDHWELQTQNQTLALISSRICSSDPAWDSSFGTELQTLFTPVFHIFNAIRDAETNAYIITAISRLLAVLLARMVSSLGRQLLDQHSKLPQARPGRKLRTADNIAIEVLKKAKWQGTEKLCELVRHGRRLECIPFGMLVAADVKQTYLRSSMPAPCKLKSITVLVHASFEECRLFRYKDEFEGVTKRILESQQVWNSLPNKQYLLESHFLGRQGWTTRNDSGSQIADALLLLPSHQADSQFPDGNIVNISISRQDQHKDTTCSPTDRHQSLNQGNSNSVAQYQTEHRSLNAPYQGIYEQVPRDSLLDISACISPNRILQTQNSDGSSQQAATPNAMFSDYTYNQSIQQSPIPDYNPQTGSSQSNPELWLELMPQLHSLKSFA